MRLPRYMVLNNSQHTEKGVQYNLHIKWWGFPVLFFKAIKNGNLAVGNWHSWLILFAMFPGMWFKFCGRRCE